jgi:hypothetical protein
MKMGSRVTSANGALPSSLGEQQRYILYATILISTLLALVHEFRSSIWYDEAITLLTVSGHAGLNWPLGLEQFHPSANFSQILRELYQQDVHPPLYFWVLALWRVLLGGTLEIARGLSVVFTIGTLWMIYRYAIELELQWPALPSLLYALSAVGLRYAYNARPYAMASFLIVLTLWTARRASRWTGICAAACVATHYFAALLVVPLLLFEGFRRWNSNRRWVYFTCFSFVLGSLPLLPLLRAHFTARPRQYPGFGNPAVEIGALLKGTVAGAMPSSWLPHWGIAVFVGAVFVVLGFHYLAKRKEWVVLATCVSFLCGFLLLALLTNKSIAQMPVEYYTGLATPLVAILMAAGLVAAPRLAPVLLVLLAVGNLTPATITKSIDYRQMAERIYNECPNCPILVGKGYAGAVPACLLYESRGSRVVLLDGDDSIDDVLRNIGSSDVAILVPTPNEPSPESLERKLIRNYPSQRKGDYYEIRFGDGEEGASIAVHSLP